MKNYASLLILIMLLIPAANADECMPRDFKKGDQIIAKNHGMFGSKLSEIIRVDVENNYKLITDKGDYNYSDVCLFVPTTRITNDRSNQVFSIGQWILTIGNYGTGYAGQIKRISANGYVEIPIDSVNSFFNIDKIRVAKKIDSTGQFSVGGCVLDNDNKSDEIVALYEDPNENVYANLEGEKFLGVLRISTAYVVPLTSLKPDPNDDCHLF